MRDNNPHCDCDTPAPIFSGADGVEDVFCLNCLRPFGNSYALPIIALVIAILVVVYFIGVQHVG